MGGTSVGAPAWAAVIAIADQGRAIAGLSPLTGGTQVLPVLYAASPSDYHKVALTAAGSEGSNLAINTASYTTQTGLGTPVGSALVSTLVRSTTTEPNPTPTPTPTPVSTPVSPISTPTPTPTPTPSPIVTPPPAPPPRPAPVTKKKHHVAKPVRAHDRTRPQVANTDKARTEGHCAFLIEARQRGRLTPEVPHLEGDRRTQFPATFLSRNPWFLSQIAQSFGHI